MTDRPPGEDAPRLDTLIDAELLVPIRSSSGEAPDAERLSPDAYRHGTDDAGERFIAAFTALDVMAEHGPPGSDHVRLPARDLFERADAAQERVVIDPGAPTQVEIAVGVLPFLAAGIDPTTPEAMRARRPHGELPPLEIPSEVPQPFGAELHRELSALPQVERAWLLRAGSGWTVGVLLGPEADLAAFDEVRNRLHTLAGEHLGGRRELAVTDIGAAPVREAYESVSGAWYVKEPDKPKGFLNRLFGD